MYWMRLVYLKTHTSERGMKVTILAIPPKFQNYGQSLEFGEQAFFQVPIPELCY